AGHAVLRVSILQVHGYVQRPIAYTLRRQPRFGWRRSVDFRRAVHVMGGQEHERAADRRMFRGCHDRLSQGPTRGRPPMNLYAPAGTVVAEEGPAPHVDDRG